jgi:carbamoyl-phosphate synthase large subunit
VSLNVLITAGSRRVPLVQAFQRALCSTGGGSVVVTDVNPLSPAVYVADRAHQVPLSTEPGYLDDVLAICRTEHIGLVVPTIDDELQVFAEGAARFAAAGVRVAVSPTAAIATCNDKLCTSQFLAARGLPVVETFLPADLPADRPFPLFIKPRVGRGGVGAFPVQNARELEFFRDYVAEPVLQPFLDGPEFTIDVLSDFDGRVIASVPRQRVVIRAGVVDRGRTVRDGALIELGRASAEALGTVGPINVQCRVVDGEPRIFEVNPRFSGGIPLTIAAGADFPLWLVLLARGRRVDARIGKFQDDLWMTSYETSLFVAASSIGFSTAPAIAEVA